MWSELVFDRRLVRILCLKIVMKISNGETENEMKVTGRATQIDPDKVNKGIFVTLAVFGLSSSGLNI